MTLTTQAHASPFFGDAKRVVVMQGYEFNLIWSNMSRIILQLIVSSSGFTEQGLKRNFGDCHLNQRVDGGRPIYFRPRSIRGALQEVLASVRVQFKAVLAKVVGSFPD